MTCERSHDVDAEDGQRSIASLTMCRHMPTSPFGVRPKTRSDYSEVRPGGGLGTGIEPYVK